MTKENFQYLYIESTVSYCPVFLSSSVYQYEYVTFEHFQHLRTTLKKRVLIFKRPRT
jgi:hypothetical protein